MPRQKRKVSKQRPDQEELQAIASWLLGDELQLAVEAGMARAAMYFIDERILQQLWNEIRAQALPLYRKDPAAFEQQIDQLSAFSLLSDADQGLLGSQPAGRRPM